MSRNNDIFDHLNSNLELQVQLNGDIIYSNQNGQVLIESYGSHFFNHFREMDRKQVYLFLQELTLNDQVLEQVFYQKKNGDYKPIRYRGKWKSGRIFLVGHWESEASEYRQEAIPMVQQIKDLSEKIFSSLNIAVITLNASNQIQSANQVSYKLGLVRDGSSEPHSIIHMIQEMADQIRLEDKGVQAFHYYSDSLHHVHGIFNRPNDTITFIIDDRTCSEEFDTILQHKQQMESISHLAAGFAHELRNPLSIIRGFIQLSFLSKDNSKYYETILSELNRMNEIIDDFLSLSRRTSKKRVQNPYDMFSSLIPLIRSECLFQNIKLLFDFERTTRLLLLNDSMIKQIILNLLRNSIEAFGENYPKEKNFSIYGLVDVDFYTIQVRDNGPGIEQNVLEKIGKPFFTTKEKGTGIGLPLCKKIIEDHHGKFNIVSELGKGTTISLSFPFI